MNIFLGHQLRPIIGFNLYKTEMSGPLPTIPMDTHIEKRTLSIDRPLITTTVTQGLPIARIFPEVQINIRKVQSEERHQRGEADPKEKESNYYRHIQFKHRTIDNRRRTGP